MRAGGQARGALLRELNALSQELKLAGRLIEHGAAFYRGWARMLGAAAAGYLPTGEAASIAGLAQTAGNISVCG